MKTIEEQIEIAEKSLYRELTKQDFSDKNMIMTSMSNFRAAQKMTKEQKEKYLSLAKKIGHPMYFLTRGKKIRCKVVAVSFPDITVSENENYLSFPFEFRMRPDDYTREEYWTRRIEWLSEATL